MNRQAKIRLSRFYGAIDLKERNRLQREIPSMVLNRKSKQCNFIEYQGKKRGYSESAGFYSNILLLCLAIVFPCLCFINTSLPLALAPYYAFAPYNHRTPHTLALSL